MANGNSSAKSTPPRGTGREGTKGDNHGREKDVGRKLAAKQPNKTPIEKGGLVEGFPATKGPPPLLAEVKELAGQALVQSSLRPFPNGRTKPTQGVGKTTPGREEVGNPIGNARLAAAT
jgi:hypothetical protein